MISDLKLYVNDRLSLREVVFETLRQAILTGLLKPGERLPEIHLANQLGVSRTPVREAIRMLELDNLVVMLPRKGAEVASISEDTLRDVLEVRRTLDVLSAELACERMSEEDKERLVLARKQFEKDTGTADKRQIARADVDFHGIILASTGNKKLIQMVNTLSEQMYRYRFEYLQDINAYSHIIEEHAELCQAIIDGDKEQAAKITVCHIDGQENAILAKIRKDVR